MVDIYVEKAEDVWYGVAFKDEKVYGTTFASTEKNALRSLSECVRYDVSGQSQKPTQFAKHVTALLKGMYDGKNVDQNLTLKSERLSKYAMSVIDAVSKVPTGYVTSYGDVAKAVGGGPRAVGQIMARNPFAPVCPCHRVLSSDLTLGGYGGGLDVKLAFLKREKRGYKSEKEIPLNGKKLRVFPVELAIRKAEEG
jgi:methylated-DNA-[protein]-cysteine S-methyltransferase